jgi:hypothetical protein
MGGEERKVVQLPPLPTLVEQRGGEKGGGGDTWPSSSFPLLMTLW